MSVSEHANYLLNEYGRLQFDYAAYCKPYGESLRNEARNNLETYIAELEAAQRWIPVSERLPEDEKTVFVVINDVLEHTNEVARLTYLGNGNWWSWKSERYIVTHWMPLPEPPEVQESEATACKFCGSDKSDIRMNSIVCSSCGRKIGNVAPPEVQE